MQIEKFFNWVSYNCIKRMMLHNSSNGNIQGSLKQSCSVLAVLCDSSKLREWETEDRLQYPFTELESFSRLEVCTEFILHVGSLCNYVFMGRKVDFFF